MQALLGKKGRMTQMWKENIVVPVTVIEVAPNIVSLVRTKERDGYEAIQVTLRKTKREFRLKDAETAPAEGEMIGVSLFKEGDKVCVSGLNKGRGFQGVVKRHGFHGGPKSHGQKNRLRHPGSIGSTAPQRVLPGKRMGGHMGTERTTVKNLLVAAVDTEKNLLMLRGAVPGMRGSIIEIRKM